MTRIEALFEPFQQPGAPGASVIAVRDGAVVCRSAWGLANVEAGLPATPATNYRLASVTKQITAMAILLLVHARSLALDATIARWLAGLPGYARGVTIRQLLTHTSGLIDYEDRIPPGQALQVHDAEIPGLLPAENGLYFAPGSAYRYSNTGYVLLALLAEQSSGMRFADLLHTRIFAPLGMTTTLAHEEGRTSVPQRAYGYTWRGTCFERSDQSVTSATLGDGGVYSSVDDMARWAAALEDETLLPASLMRQVFRKHTAANSEAGYGFGWFIGQRGGEPIVYHDGTTVGFRTAIARYPRRHLAVIVLTNRSVAEPLELAHQVAAAL